MSTAPGKATAGRKNQFSDSQLVKECLKGSEAAWSRLVNKYKNLIFSIPVRHGFSEADSSDIFQAVCMDLLTELPRLRRPNALAGWLIEVTRNKCFHRRQAQQRSKVRPIEDQDQFNSQDEPEGVVSQMQQQQALWAAVSHLSPRCQQLVHMLFFELPPRPYQVVAKELELALGSIGFIRRRCLDKLRKQLELTGYCRS
jgi:RNA polymerase sigma factor (sigma-70 family)